MKTYSQKLDQETLEYFINGFVQAMLFTCYDDNGDALDANFSGGDIDHKSFELIKSRCLAFLDLANNLLDCGDLEQHGMDFYFVSNGLGVGFVDRDNTPLNRVLTVLAREFKELHVWTENGEVFCE
jgi:hypothetical protein